MISDFLGLAVKERIIYTFAADGRVLAVAAANPKVVVEGMYISFDRFDQLRIVAAWQVGSPDRAAEKAIAGEYGLFFVRDKHIVPQGVAGAMAHL